MLCVLAAAFGLLAPSRAVLATYQRSKNYHSVRYFRFEMFSLKDTKNRYGTSPPYRRGAPCARSGIDVDEVRVWPSRKNAENVFSCWNLGFFLRVWLVVAGAGALLRR